MQDGGGEEGGVRVVSFVVLCAASCLSRYAFDPRGMVRQEKGNISSGPHNLVREPGNNPVVQGTEVFYSSTTTRIQLALFDFN